MRYFLSFFVSLLGCAEIGLDSVQSNECFDGIGHTDSRIQRWMDVSIGFFFLTTQINIVIGIIR